MLYPQRGVTCGTGLRLRWDTPTQMNDKMGYLVRIESQEVVEIRG
jgi:hypothetical protein